MTYNLTHFEITETLDVVVKARTKNLEEKKFNFKFREIPQVVLDDDFETEQYLQTLINKKNHG